MDRSTMNPRLAALAERIGLNDASRSEFALAFGLACIERIAHLLLDERALQGLAAFRSRMAAKADATAIAAFESAKAEVAAVAAAHRGSDSIDGVAHAAVSATHALARAMAGKAQAAADYAAYAAVYASGGYAVNDPESFAIEFDWQLQTLERLSAGE